jgi:hypothetical protein
LSEHLRGLSPSRGGLDSGGHPSCGRWFVFSPADKKIKPWLSIFR